MSRDFNGSSRIVLDEGALDTILNGGWTVLALLKPTSVPGFVCALSIETTGPSQRMGLWVSNVPELLLVYGGVNYTFTGLGITPNNWYLAVIKKASGTATPRANLYSYTTATWDTWTDAGGTAGNDGSTIASVRLGDWPNINPFIGPIAAAAVYGSALADVIVEALTASAADWLAQIPLAMWRLNQATTATAVTDDTGGGADQTAITGTTVSADEPAGWTYSLDGGEDALATGPRIVTTSPTRFETFSGGRITTTTGRGRL